MKTGALGLRRTTEDRETGAAGLNLSHVDLWPQHRGDPRDPNPFLQQDPDSRLGLACPHVATDKAVHLLALIDLAILTVTLDPYSPN